MNIEKLITTLVFLKKLLVNLCRSSTTPIVFIFNRKRLMRIGDKTNHLTVSH